MIGSVEKCERYSLYLEKWCYFFERSKPREEALLRFALTPIEYLVWISHLLKLPASSSYDYQSYLSRDGFTVLNSVGPVTLRYLVSPE